MPHAVRTATLVAGIWRIWWYTGCTVETGGICTVVLIVLEPWYLTVLPCRPVNAGAVT